MIEVIKKTRLTFWAERFFALLCLFIFTLYVPQTQNDVSLLREEILDQMQYQNKELEPMLNYYSKISPVEAQILRVKSLLIIGDYEKALDRLLVIKKNGKRR